jgi:hypothetical protein
VKQELQKLHATGRLSLGEKFMLNVRNPRMPHMYALPKTHKKGGKMRPIVSNVNVPTSGIAKYLTRKAKETKEPKGFSVKNSRELIEKMKDLTIDEDEELVSFDVKALFPSVPRDKAIQSITEWIDEQEISDIEAEKFLQLSKVCVRQYTFKWDGRFFKQKSGLSIGNGFSPFAANLFMSKLEWEVKNQPWFPRFWARYVDDVIAIVKRDKIEEMMESLNNLSPTIRFTIEREVDRKLPFLDLMLEVKGGEIEMMIFRIFNTLLSAEKFAKEKKFIKETAVINGYKKKMIWKGSVEKSRKK